MGTSQDWRCLPRLVRVSRVAQGRGCPPRLLYFAAVQQRESRQVTALVLLCRLEQMALHVYALVEVD
jgi:hypothetical protein